MEKTINTKPLPVIEVNHADNWGWGYKYTLECPICRSRVEYETQNCKTCGQLLEWNWKTRTREAVFDLVFKT